MVGFFADHIALTVDQPLGGSGTENTRRAGSTDIQCAAAAFPAAHGKNDSLCLDLKDAVRRIGGGDDFISS